MFFYPAPTRPKLLAPKERTYSTKRLKHTVCKTNGTNRTLGNVLGVTGGGLGLGLGFYNIIGPDNTHGSNRPISFMRIKYTPEYNTRERPSVNFGQLLCISEIYMYHATCKVEFQSFNRSYSQMTFLNIHKI